MKKVMVVFFLCLFVCRQAIASDLSSMYDDCEDRCYQGLKYKICHYDGVLVPQTYYRIEGGCLMSIRCPDPDTANQNGCEDRCYNGLKYRVCYQDGVLVPQAWYNKVGTLLEASVCENS